MREELPEKRIDRKRLALYAAGLAVLAAAAWIFLPRGVTRMALAGVLVLPAGLVLFDRPRWILYLLLWFIFSSIHIFLDFPVIMPLSLLLAGSWAFSAVKTGRLVVHDRMFAILTVAFLLAAFQSMIVARDLESSLFRLDRFVKNLAVIFFIAQFSSDRRDLFRIFGVVISASLVSCFLPFVLPPPETQDLSLMWNEGIYRYEGYFREANMFAYSITFLLPLLLFLFARMKRPLLMRPLVALAIGGTIFVLTLSFSRGGFVSLAAMLLALLVIERRNKAVLVTGLAMIAIGVIAAPAAYWDRIGSLVEIGNRMTEDTAILSRIYTMKVALILGIENPLFGVGIENFLFHVSRFISLPNVVHNIFLQVFSDLGLPGTVLFLWIVIYDFRVTRDLIRTPGDPVRRLAGRMLLVQQIAVIVNSLFLPVAYDLILWVTLALPTLVRYAFARPREVSPPGPSHRMAGLHSE